jgi:hypothetical protein
MRASYILMFCLIGVGLQGQRAHSQTADSARLQATRRCDVAIEIVKTGDSRGYSRALTRYPEAHKRAWAYSYIRTCGARGAAALGAEMLAKRSSRDTAELRSVWDATRGFLDGNLFQAAARIAADGAAGPEARVFAFRALMWSFEPRLELQFAGLVAGTGRCVAGMPFDVATWEGSPLPGNRRKQVEDVARQVLASSSAPEQVRNAAACALQEAQRKP